MHDEAAAIFVSDGLTVEVAGRTLVEALTLSVARGELLAVLGHSGKAWSYISGYNPKNTLAALLGCLSKASEVIGLILDTADRLQAEKVAA